MNTKITATIIEGSVYTVHDTSIVALVEVNTGTECFNIAVKFHSDLTGIEGELSEWLPMEDYYYLVSHPRSVTTNSDKLEIKGIVRSEWERFTYEDGTTEIRLCYYHGGYAIMWSNKEK